MTVFPVQEERCFVGSNSKVVNWIQGVGMAAAAALLFFSPYLSNVANSYSKIILDLEVNPAGEAPPYQPLCAYFDYIPRSSLPISLSNG